MDEGLVVAQHVELGTEAQHLPLRREARAGVAGVFVAADGLHDGVRGADACAGIEQDGACCHPTMELEGDV
ncbi:hypothetical protein GOP47_0000176 [Adiantum capillus-veneris]|uniref:Uncharacterized protein n=1 Tax=Adiantum capillus-veneris TaxID=13818 RepID=A0A9D4ZSM2_ADICA|nr:hypothetical protein GOP47_0000176 [Adiantum capillus-veneris]